jgi:hypothetical protein
MVEPRKENKWKSYELLSPSVCLLLEPMHKLSTLGKTVLARRTLTALIGMVTISLVFLAEIVLVKLILLSVLTTGQ